MKKILLIVFVLSFLFTACSKDDITHKDKNNIEIDGISYQMPPVISNVNLLKDKLKTISDNVLVSKNGELTDIKVRMNSGDDLFKELHYIITYSNNDFQTLELTYKFNSSKSVNTEIKHKITDYFKSKLISF